MPRLSLRALGLAAAASFLAACGGDSITGPQRNARQMAARFEKVADSLALAGNYDAADGASVLAGVLRMTDRLHTVTASVDGGERSYNALLLQLQLPELECLPEEPCEPMPEFMQVVVGWRGEDVTDGFAFVMTRTGTLTVPSPFVDGPAGDPLGAAPLDVFGGLFERVGERAWLAASGVVRTDRARSVGSCERAQAVGPMPPGFECRVGLVTFGADVGLYETTEEGTIIPDAQRTFRIADQSIAGLALTITEIPDQMRARLSPRRLLPMLH